MVNPIVFMIVKNGKPIYTYNYDNNVKKLILVTRSTIFKSIYITFKFR